MMVPLRVAVTLNFAHRIVALDFEDAQGTRSVRDGEYQTMVRGTHDVVVNHPDSHGLHSSEGVATSAPKYRENCWLEFVNF